MAYSAHKRDDGEIAARFSTDDGNRSESLERARLCAALTKPNVLPPRSQDSETKLPESFQSIGAWGVTNFVGAMHGATFPAGLPWFQLSLPPEIEFNDQIDTERKVAILNDLFAIQVSAQSMVDGAHLDEADNNRLAAAFFSRKHASLTQLAITGDTLELILPDYRIKVFRRDKYVVKRDDTGSLLYHITCENVDPLGAMTIEQCESCGLKVDELRDRPVCERMKPLFTLVEWHPLSKRWVIRQEVDGKLSTLGKDNKKESEESVSPYFSTPYELVGGEDYGRGFVEQNLGDLRSVNALEKRILEFADLCSRFYACPDQNCQVDRNDLKAPPGSVVEGFRVTGAEVQDFTWLKMNNYPDFKVVNDTVTRKHGNLARAMLIESEITPQKERTTATQVNRVANQLQSATGGMFSTIVDQQQIPLARRLVHMMRRDKVLAKWPDRSVKIEVLTGLAAVAKQAKLGNLLGALDVLQRLSPNFARRIKEQNVIDAVFRYSNLHEVGLIKTDAEIAAEDQKAIAGQVQVKAGEAAAQAMANVGEAALTQQSMAA